jgi:hypothetical protein
MHEVRDVGMRHECMYSVSTRLMDINMRGVER